MAQWVNCLWNNIFINPPLPLLCEYSGVLHLAQLGLTAGGRQAGGWVGGWVGGQAGRQAGRQTKYR